jgi:hypothetical protein
MAVSFADRLTPEEAAVVFRRAAELEASGTHGDNAPLLDADALVAIGREAGLSAAAVLAALEEVRRVNELPDQHRAFDIITSRVVPGPVIDVSLAVDELARRNLLTKWLQRDATTVWRRQAGLGRSLVRTLGGRGRYPLGSLKELRATVTNHEGRPGFVRIRLEGCFAHPWQVLPFHTQGLVGAGLAGGALSFNWALQHSNDLLAFSAWGAAACLGAFGVGMRSYAKTAARTDAALQVFLARLELGHPVSLGLLR